MASLTVSGQRSPARTDPAGIGGGRECSHYLKVPGHRAALSRDLSVDDPRVGTGGPGYVIPCETVGNRRRHHLGTLSMAHEGRDTGGSQFFFVLDEDRAREWNGVHTVFGQTTHGLEVLRVIERGDAVLTARVWE